MVCGARAPLGVPRRHAALARGLRRCDAVLRHAVVSPELVGTLDRDWPFVGEVNQMRAYGRPGQAICFLRWEDSWRIFAGASTQRRFVAIATELGLRWE